MKSNHHKKFREIKLDMLPGPFATSAPGGGIPDVIKAQLEHEEWYHGPVSRDNAERLLKNVSVAQCGNLTNFLPLRFFVKSFLGVSKTAILTILEALNVDFGKSLHFLQAKICQNKKFRSSKTAKMADFEVLD